MMHSSLIFHHFLTVSTAKIVSWWWQRGRAGNRKLTVITVYIKAP